MSYQLNKTWAESDQATTEVIDTGLQLSGTDVIVGGLMYTADGGVAKQYIYKGGGTSVKGEVLHPSLTTADAVTLETSEFDGIAIAYESGIADGEMIWCVMSGSAMILLEDGTDTDYGNWVFAAAVDGRADASLAQPAGGTIAALTNHFKEIGHSLDSQVSGTDVLAKIHIHFN